MKIEDLFAQMPTTESRQWQAMYSAMLHELEKKELKKRSKLPFKRLLVIGGGGYIGSAVVRKLLALGCHVRVLDLLLYGDDPVAELYSHPRFELVRGDFCHLDSVVAAAKDVDAIVHLGAIVGDAACKLCEDLTVEINLRATQRIAEVGKGLGVKRFVFASTCSVYGASNDLLDENSTLQPISLYARTKVASERVLLGLAGSTFAPVILRFGTIYGLSHRPRFDLVVNLLTAKALQDGEASIFGGGQWRPLLHVQDAAEAVIQMLQAPQSDVCGEIFNVGSNDQNYQMIEIGRLIKEMLPEARVVHQSTEDERNYRVCFDKIHDRVGFETLYTVPDGVNQIVMAFRSGAITDYKHPRFNNFIYLSQHSEVRQALLDDISARGISTVAASGEIVHGAPAAMAAPQNVAAENSASVPAPAVVKVAA
jgi:nucleoside-diphosphate-sugar epimerase